MSEPHPLARRIPLRPDLDQLRRRAKELLRRYREGHPEAVAAFEEFHTRAPPPTGAGLSDAQQVLARIYGASHWPRLVQACELIDAIWNDDIEAVSRLVRAHPDLLHESTLIRKSHWGPPMSFAANVGRGRLVECLKELGATDFEKALDRASLQGHTDIAWRIHGWMGSPAPPIESLSGPAYTLNVEGTRFLLKAGAPVHNPGSGAHAPVDVVLETDSRNPEAKHAILELYVSHGLSLPETAPMALHRGRIDQLERHLDRDPSLPVRTFMHEEIYPPDLGCHDEVLATHGTPLAGATLLHMCVDYDEIEIAEWLLAHGADPNTPAEIDEHGFGGHSALFSAVVSQANYWRNRGDGPDEEPFTRLLLDHGADPNPRVSLRKQLHPGYGPHELREYPDVTPLSWGRTFEDMRFVSQSALRQIEAAGGLL